MKRVERGERLKDRVTKGVRRIKWEEREGRVIEEESISREEGKQEE